MKKIKQALCQKLVLYTLDFNQTFILQMDASGVALEAVLIQEKEEIKRPIVYASYKLLEHECLAVKWAVNQFCY